MSGIKHRMNRFFRENGKAFIMAMDHGTLLTCFQR
jgi:DhnA family fructose-bisphosphate aldolase class Ia